MFVIILLLICSPRFYPISLVELGTQTHTVTIDIATDDGHSRTQRKKKNQFNVYGLKYTTVKIQFFLLQVCF